MKNAAPPKRYSDDVQVVSTPFSQARACSQDSSNDREVIPVTREISVEFDGGDSLSTIGLASTCLEVDSPVRRLTRTATTALSNMVDISTPDAACPLLENSSRDDVSRPRRITRAATLPAAAVVERKDSWKRQLITLEPGLALPLRGSEETLEALSQNLLVHVECKACDTFLHCINTAEFVLCSVCRSISKVDGTVTTAGESLSPSQQSIGLGLTVEDIISSQC